MKTHSQHGEDFRINELLKAADHALYVVDVGANDGFSWSNSLAFVEMGYSALLIEPMPKYARFCRMQHRGNPNVFVEEVAVLPNIGTCKFFINEDLANDLLSMTSSVKRDIINSDNIVEIEVETCPLSFLLAKYRVPKNYGVLNVDAEGVDLEVLMSADLESYRPAVVCVEYGTNEDAIHRYMRSMRYEKRDHLGPNGIYTKAN